MTRAIADLKRDISALSRADKEKLLDFLMFDIESPPEEFWALVRDLSVAVERTSRSLHSALAYLEGSNERMAQQRIRVREEVLRSQERWPFPKPPVSIRNNEQ
jgi:hypothetical protein